MARSIGHLPHTEAIVPYRNIADLLEHRAGRTPEAPYLIVHRDDLSRSEYTYGAFSRRVAQAANLLGECGIRRGDRVATMVPNSAETVILYFAAWAIGASVVPVNAGEDDQRIAYILSNAGVTIAFVRDRFAPRLREIAGGVPMLTRLIVVGDAGGEPSFEDHLARQPDTRDAATVTLEDEALVVYTSGTTGNPKGVVLVQYNLLIDAKGIAEWHGIDAATRMMCVLPIHHVNGTVVTLVTPMVAGGSVVLNERFHPDRFFRIAGEEHVAIASVVPTLLAFLLDQYKEHASPSDVVPQEFRHLICGAGPLTCDLAARFEDRFGIPIIHGYGLSETTCYSCFMPVDLPREEHTAWMRDFGFPSIGVAIPQNVMDIHDDAGQSLAAGARGEIVIRGHNVMKEYFSNPEANDNAFTHGWFRSGDEGFWMPDAKGRRFFFISGRFKELIIRGGVNISPLEIDEIINRCPGVRAGIAVGFDNDVYGEEVGAFVVRSDERVTDDAILAHCRDHLPFSKSPKVVVFGEQIPVTATGKYQRNRVKALFDGWKSVQFRQP